MAATIRRELQEDVEMIHGPKGDFQVLVDGVRVIGQGLLSSIGIVPSDRAILEAVRARLAQASR